VTPRLKIITGLFELQKPYFNLDTNNADRDLGVQRAKGFELSIAAELLENLRSGQRLMHARAEQFEPRNRLVGDHEADVLGAVRSAIIESGACPRSWPSCH